MLYMTRFQHFLIACIALTLLVKSCSGRSCPEHAIGPTGRCYWITPWFSQQKLAQNKCQENGGHLASLDSLQTQNFLIETLEYSRSEALLWIGLNDLDTEGVYKWSDGTPVTWVQWALGNPTARAGQNCGVVDINLKVRDSYCWINSERQGLCESKQEFSTIATPFPTTFLVTDERTTSFSVTEETVSNEQPSPTNLATTETTPELVIENKFCRPRNLHHHCACGKSVEIFDSNESGLCTSATFAFQKSTFQNYEADLAIDENTKSCAVIGWNSRPWWRTELSTSCNVHTIRLCIFVNPCGSSELININVKFANETNSVNELDNVLSGWRSVLSCSDRGEFEITVRQATRARFVQLEFTNVEETYLQVHICDVKLFEP